MLLYIVVDLLTKQRSTRISTGSQIPPMLTPELEAMARDNQMLMVDSRVADVFLPTEHRTLSDQRRRSLVLTLSLWCSELICCGEWRDDVLYDMTDTPMLLTATVYLLSIRSLLFNRLKVKVIVDVAILTKYWQWLEQQEVSQAEIGYLQCYFHSTLLLLKKIRNNIMCG